MRLVFRFFLTFISLFFLSHGYAQEVLSNIGEEEFRSSMLSYIEVKNQELLSELDSIKASVKSSSPITADDIEILKRSKSLSKTIPLDYNDRVKYFIDKYTSKNYRPYMNKMLGLSKHYFPIYEPILKGADIPEEVKYLSLVESSLNPHLVSTSGAVGPWQFMYPTAKQYKLDMNSHIDERKDAYSASYAMSQYLSEAYLQFGDWLLAIASYNCGRGCVQRAIERSGIEQPTFWQLSPLLPEETRNYIPKYIAMTYVLSDPSYYEIRPESQELNHEHKVVLVDRFVNLDPIANAIGISNDELKKYNPAYKRNIINGTPDKPRRLLLPITHTTSDSLLYLALHDNASNANFNNQIESSGGLSTYKVKRGETLSSISKKFDVSVQNLRAWNNLNSRSVIAAGKILVIEKPINDKLANTAKIASAKASAKKSSSNLVYTVKKGDSLDKIANKHNGVTVAKLKADNGLKSNVIKPGMKLKINKG